MNAADECIFMGAAGGYRNESRACKRLVRAKTPRKGVFKISL